MVLIGEIDCREGILLALERNYYENYDQAIQSTLRVFLPVLKEAVLRRKLLRVNVHPIVPVLDITRPMVMRFNRAYKEAVAKLRGMMLPTVTTQLQTGTLLLATRAVIEL